MTRKLAIVLVLFVFLWTALVVADGTATTTMTVWTYYNSPPANVIEVRYHNRTVLRIRPADKVQRRFLLYTVWCSAPTVNGICYAVPLDAWIIVTRHARLTVTKATE